MERYLADQTVVFAWAAGLGLALGLLYDVTVCACKAARAGRVARGLWDLIMCALALLLMVLFLLTVGGGEMRSYIIIGCVLGMTAWFLALSRPVRALLMPLFRMLRQVAGRCRRGIVRAFSYPRGN